MTTPVLATVTLKAANGNPDDDAKNDFVFELATFTSGDADDLRDAIASFYNTVQTIPGTDTAIADYIGPQISRSSLAHTIAMYNLTGHLDGSDHGSPTYTRSWTLNAETISNLGLPSEVAVKASFHGDLDGVLERVGATRPAARRRGGVFIGPLSQRAEDTGVTTDQPMVLTNLRDCIAAANLLLAESMDAGLRVWSRADAAVYPVVGGWIDDAFDTQRRRGPAFTSRTLWAI